MINRILLENVATFKNKIEINPSLINYIYGFNGSGKTTISKVLCNPTLYNNCLIENTEDKDCEILVYNNEFVDEIFRESSKLKGIFTLGKDSGDAMEKILKNKEEIAILEKENKSLKNGIEIKSNELSQYNEDLKDKCWNLKTKLNKEFSKALSGFGSSKEKFKNRCLEEKFDKENLLDLNLLKRDYELLYDQTNFIFPGHEIKMLESSELTKIENEPIFKEIIKGNEEMSVSELINKLNNSDWVKKGLDEYLTKSNNKCPFCQQELTNNIHKIAEYFNTEYNEKYLIIQKLKKEYIYKGENVEKIIGEIKNRSIPLDNEFHVLVEKFNNIFSKNKEIIEKKIDKLSMSFELYNTEDIVNEMNNYIQKVNKTLREINKKLFDRENERIKFYEKLWNYILNELETDILSYRINVENCNKGLVPMKTKYDENLNRITTLKKEIKENEKKITGTEETLYEINKVLNAFGFEGFKLGEGDLKGTYKIIRPDGTNVNKSLSEGEFRFISFLYYYHLINGSNNPSGVIRKKILVIDDPISSLDSNSLFIISTLVKKLINECFEKKNDIKQVFVLTHNVYFYKEIVFRGNRETKKESKEKYFVLSKKNEISGIKEYKKNPIETTYQLLWEELKDENISMTTCCNTMRRILEYYFNIIGKKNYEKEIDEFEGEEKLICKSLISCINDNSHYINDELNIVFDEELVQKYKKTFRKIFEKLGHLEHYKMMIKEEG